MVSPGGALCAGNFKVEVAICLQDAVFVTIYDALHELDEAFSWLLSEERAVQKQAVGTPENLSGFLSVSCKRQRSQSAI